MPAYDGEEDRHPKPEGDIDTSEHEKYDNSEHFFQLRHKTGAKHSKSPHCNSHGKYSNSNDRTAGQEFSYDNGVPVNRLGHKTIQRTAHTFSVNCIEAQCHADKGTQQSNEAGKRGNGIAAGGI